MTLGVAQRCDDPPDSVEVTAGNPLPGRAQLTRCAPGPRTGAEALERLQGAV